jgi:hypothetical protein
LLPPIIPVVVHHSAAGWTAPVAFSELLDVWRRKFATTGGLVVPATG